MKKKDITVSAPGKLLLMGDHAVVYDRPCLVAAIDKRIYVTIKESKDLGLSIHAPDIGLSNYRKDFSQLTVGTVPKEAGYIEQAVYEFIKVYPIDDGIEISTSAPELDARFGFGTSAATLGATVAALDQYAKTELSRKELFDIAYSAVIGLKGVGSGADIAASLYGSVLYFITGGKEIKPVSSLEKLHIIAAYSGYKADTPTLIRKLADRRANEKEVVDQLFDLIQDCVETGVEQLLESDWASFGESMNKHQEYLRRLGVSTPELDEICRISKENGAYGAKISGAGGGDVAIVLVNDVTQNQLIDKLEAAGYATMKLSTDKEGVRVEKSE